MDTPLPRSELYIPPTRPTSSLASRPRLIGRLNEGLYRMPGVTLISAPPGALHHVIASRTDPTLPLSRLRACGQLTEIRQANLRFTTDKVAALVK